MGGDHRFWYFFGGIWLLVGVGFVAASAGVNLFVEPGTIKIGMSPWIFFAVGLVMAGAGGAIIYFARRAFLRDRRLRESGVTIPATVIDVRRSMIEINRQTRWHVVYRYEYTKGRPLRGESRALPGEEVWNYKPGDTVSIKVDPQQPEVNLFVGRIVN